MNQCTRLSDRMPAVARGTERWSAAEEAHLGACGDCSSEWVLVGRAAGLGDSVVLDIERVTGGVLSALRLPAPSRAAKVLRWALPVALAASLLLVLVRTRWTRPTGPAAVTYSLLPEAESLSDSELESVLQLIPTAEPNLGGVDSLSEDELTQIVKDLEG
ncbi:MAG TPA: hypothetical protein VJU15_15465 [Gemmatimonadales bacterium]|nr:hypothetical protein [Gemmatimonadales bacterium]